MANVGRKEQTDLDIQLMIAQVLWEKKNGNPRLNTPALRSEKAERNERRRLKHRPKWHLAEEDLG